MNTFEKHFSDFPEFIENVLSWKPDFVVPVAKKACKLLKTVTEPKEIHDPNLVRYRTFFELSNAQVKGKRIAVVDDATQYTSTLQDYRRFFENLGATVRTFCFVGHEELLKGLRWQEDGRAEVSKWLSEPAYQEYILQQSYHLLKSEQHFDLEHLIFETSIAPRDFEALLKRFHEFGLVLFVEDYFLKTATRRFSLDDLGFFDCVPFLSDPSIHLGAIRKIKFAYNESTKKMAFSPLVFPTWTFKDAPIGAGLFQSVPFELPYKLPDHLDPHNKGSLLRAYYNMQFTAGVALAKAFVRAVWDKQGAAPTINLRRDDLDALLGVTASETFIGSVRRFLRNPHQYDFKSEAPARRSVVRKRRYRDFADVIDDLKTRYRKKLDKAKSRIGVHFYLTYDELFDRYEDKVSLSENIDYYCDLGVIVPSTIFRRGTLTRACRTGEPDSDYDWKRTQILIPLAIDQFRSPGGKGHPVEPTLLNKMLANFVFDYPQEIHHELHCLFGEPCHFGSLVHAYHRHRAHDKPTIYSAEKISPYYQWDKGSQKFVLVDRAKMVREINDVFDDRQEIPYSEIISYLGLLASIYGHFKKVDILNMLSICREEHYLFSHIMYNVRMSEGQFASYYEAMPSEARSRALEQSRTEAKSANEKIHLARRTEGTMRAISRRFAGQLLYLPAIRKLKSNYSPLSEAFSSTLSELEFLTSLQLALAHLCLLAETKNTNYVSHLKAPQAQAALKRYDIELPSDLYEVPRDGRVDAELIDRFTRTIRIEIDGLPADEKPLLATRLRNQSLERARNIAARWAYKHCTDRAVLLYVDLSGLRTLPSPKEVGIATYYEIVLRNATRRGGHKFYGGVGGDDAFTIGFLDIMPALECARDIKREFSQDLFLRSIGDVKFGLCAVRFDDPDRERKIISCWGDAKDCCEFKGTRGNQFRNVGELLISEPTFRILSTFNRSVTSQFVPFGDALKSGADLFSLKDIRPLGEGSNRIPSK